MRLKLGLVHACFNLSYIKQQPNSFNYIVTWNGIKQSDRVVERVLRLHLASKVKGVDFLFIGPSSITPIEKTPLSNSLSGKQKIHAELAALIVAKAFHQCLFAEDALGLCGAKLFIENSHPGFCSNRGPDV